MLYYPIAVSLNNKKVIVAGGGKVAERKIKSLLQAKARITLVSPQLNSGLTKLFRQGRFTWQARKIKNVDLEQAQIIIAATSDAKVNTSVSRWAREKKKLVNIVDNSILSDFISPAIIRKQKIIVAVYSDGKDPVFSRDLKNFLEEHWDEFLSYRRRL